MGESNAHALCLHRSHPRAGWVLTPEQLAHQLEVGTASVVVELLFLCSIAR